MHACSRIAAGLKHEVKKVVSRDPCVCRKPPCSGHAEICQSCGASFILKGRVGGLSVQASPHHVIERCRSARDRGRVVPASRQKLINKIPDFVRELLARMNQSGRCTDHLDCDQLFCLPVPGSLCEHHSALRRGQGQDFLIHWMKCQGVQQVHVHGAPDRKPGGG